MAYKTVSYGSSGDDVKKLQKALNEVGYTLEVDGKFGSKTQSAVKEYQKKKGLSVDGIVGKNTWTSLSETSTNKNLEPKKEITNTTKNIAAPTSKKRPQYQKNENVISAENNLSTWENNKPLEYKSEYSEKIDNILESILNREEFNFNMNADPLYNQYKEHYINSGKKAMLDTMANAAALSGGYSNSYAVTAGNQAYNEQLNKLNNIALNLYDRAYEKYKGEGDDLIEKIGVLRDLEGEDYNKHRDDLNDYYKTGDYLLDKLTSLSEADYKAFLEDVDAFENDRDYEYNQYIELLEQQNFYDKLKLDEEKFKEEMEFKRAEAERDQRNADRSYALSASKAKSSGSSSSEKKKEIEYLNTTVKPMTYQQFVNMTGFSGILTESEFNSRKSAKEEYGDYKNYLLEMLYKHAEY